MGMFEEVKQGLESCGIPERMRGGITRYIFDGNPPGEFLQAVIKNDLKAAVGLADDENRTILNRYVVFFYNHAPAGCWGGPEQFENWVKKFADKDKPKKIKLICPKCGSDNVWKDAIAYWSPEKQEWKLQATYDQMGCSDCGEESDELIEVES